MNLTYKLNYYVNKLALYEGNDAGEILINSSDII
jgi:hypothetical protein